MAEAQADLTRLQEQYQRDQLRRQFEADQQRRLRAGQGTGVIQPQQPEATNVVRDAFANFWGEAVGIAEAGANIGTSTLSTFGAAPMMGLAVGIDSFLVDGKGITETLENVKNATAPLIGAAYQPQTAEGQAYTQTFNEIALGMEQAANQIAGADSGPSGTVDPNLLSVRRGLNAVFGPETVLDNNLWIIPALVETGLQFAPGIVSGTSAPGRAQMLRDRKNATRRVQETGIETGFFQGRLQSDPERLEALQGHAQRILGRPINNQEDLMEIASRVVELERTESMMVDRLYETASQQGRRRQELSPDSPLLSDRQMQRRYDPQNVLDPSDRAQIGQVVQRQGVRAGPLQTDMMVLRNYYDHLFKTMAVDVEDLPVASRRLSKLDEILKSNKNRIVMINELELWRKGNNMNRPKGIEGKSPTENLAIDMLNSRYDNYMQNLFARDMIEGDRDTLRSWFMARGAAQKYYDDFVDQDFVLKLQDKEITATELKSMFLGANAVGGKNTSVRAVRQLKRVLGEDSDEFMALKMSLIWDMANPLMGKEPKISDFERFGANVNKMFGKNKELLDEFFAADELGMIRDMQAIATTMADLTPKKKIFELSTVLARFGVGHSIARAGQRVAITQGLLGRAFQIVGDNRRATYINAIAGYDVMAPIIPKRTGATTGAFLGGAAQAEEQQ